MERWLICQSPPKAFFFLSLTLPTLAMFSDCRALEALRAGMGAQNQQVGRAVHIRYPHSGSVL